MPDVPSEPVAARARAARAWWGLALGLAAVSAAVAVDPSMAWLGAWLTLCVGLAAALFGAVAGAALGAGAVVALWALPLGGPALQFGWQDLGLAGAALVAAAAGTTVHRTRRRATRAALEEARRGQLLVDAALTLATLPLEDDVLRALPPLVARVLAFEHASVLRPNGEGLEVVAIVPPVIEAGHRVPAASVAGRAARTGIAQHVTDARAEAEYVAAAGALPTRSEFALPLQVGGRTIAVLNVERERAGGFTEAERATLTALGRIAEAHVGRLRTVAAAERERREADLLAEVARQLTTTTDPAAAGGATLDLVVDALGLEGGALFTLQRGRFAALATTTSLPDDLARLAARGIPWDQGRLHEVWRHGRSVFVDDFALHEDDAFRHLGLRALALVPIRDDAGETLALFEVGTRDREHPWSRRDRRLLEAVGHMLGGSLARATQHARAAELLEVVRGMAHAADVGDLYQRAVEAALRLAPAADAASLLVRDDDAGYVYRAAVGFDLAGLQRVGPLSDEEQARWYGEGLEAFRAGRPRLRLGAAVAASSQAAVDHAPARATLEQVGRVTEIRANLCVPIAFQGDVVAILNVDAFGSEAAFGAGAFEWAAALGQHVAAIVRQAHDRAALARSALTDPLTGAGNREAFNRKVTEELARSKRHDQPLALAMIDLDGFKAINDRLGHEAGDRALTLVADTLRRHSRGSDTVYRWGGDEFAVVMPMATHDDGAHAIERFADAVGGLTVGGMRLSASAGLASYPEDGPDAESLMRRADDLMYASKRDGER